MAAHADEIGVSGAVGQITFSNGKDPADYAIDHVQGPISFSTNGFTDVDGATFQFPTGVSVETGGVLLGPMSGQLVSISPGQYAVQNLFPFGGESFTYSGPVDSLTGHITWLGVKDDTNTPQWNAGSFLTVTSSSGSAEFMRDFAPGSQAEIDMTILLEPGPNGQTALDQLICDSIIGLFSTAEIIPASPPVDEPRSLSLILGAIGTLWFAIRKRHRLFPFERAI